MQDYHAVMLPQMFSNWVPQLLNFCLWWKSLAVVKPNRNAFVATWLHGRLAWLYLFHWKTFAVANQPTFDQYTVQPRVHNITNTNIMSS